MELQKQREELRERFLDLEYEVANAAGIIWLIKHTPFLELKSWVKERDKLR